MSPALSDRIRHALTIATHMAGTACALRVLVMGSGVGATFHLSAEAVDDASEFIVRATGYTIEEAVNVLMARLAEAEVANDTTPDPEPPAAIMVREHGAFDDEGPTVDDLSRDPEFMDFCDAHATTDEDVAGLWAQLHPRHGDDFAQLAEVA